jgi:regulatory protein
VGARSRKSKSSASNTAADPWQRAVRLLAAHDRSAHEIRTALAASGVSAVRIETTLGRLRALRYVDDERFATQVAERAVQRGFGSERVRAELSAKGVTEELIAAAVAAAFADEQGLARAICTRRFGAVPVPAPQRPKAARFLHGRGFPEAIVLAILDEGC